MQRRCIATRPGRSRPLSTSGTTSKCQSAWQRPLISMSPYMEASPSRFLRRRVPKWRGNFQLWFGADFFLYSQDLSSHLRNLTKETLGKTERKPTISSAPGSPRWRPSCSAARWPTSSHLAVPTHGLELTPAASQSRLATSAWRPWQHHPGQSVIDMESWIEWMTTHQPRIIIQFLQHFIQSFKKNLIHFETIKYNFFIFLQVFHILNPNNKTPLIKRTGSRAYYVGRGGLFK